MQHYTATYSPEDNKLRLYASQRLDEETYARIRGEGFRWAPKQELFVAPMWAPGREDLLTELCGEIGDEDTSVAERAEDRAERFEGYQENRAQDAAAARDAVSGIADGIPLGQPILVGHHSEASARRDQKRIENGMRRAVKMWRTSEYWERRADGVISSASYKAKPPVRARRIKKLQAAARKVTKTKRGARESTPGPWYDICNRWLEHYNLRIKYETAILKGQGALHLLDKPKRAKLPPILNYRQEEFQVENRYNAGKFFVLEQIDLTRAQLKTIDSSYKGTRKQTGHRIRIAMMSSAYRAAGRGDELKSGTYHGEIAVFLTDSKVHDKPETAGEKPPETRRASISCATYVAPKRTDYDDMADVLKNGGIQTVVADQLFVTPPELAVRAVELAGIRFIHSVLEPSAGTGNLVLATRKDIDVLSLTAVEINRQLCDRLELLQPMQGFARWRTVCQDFLTCGAELGKFDRVVMNPPFKNGADILHVRHALRFLKPGGRLVSFCANGPKQERELKPLASEWHDLPGGSFKASGTNVNAALFVIEKCQ